MASSGTKSGEGKAKRHALVLWSGGADSTLVLWDVLQDPKIGSVHALSFDHYSVWAGKEHRRARRSIRAWLRRKGLEFRHTELAIYPHARIREFDVTSGGLQHPVIWLPNTIPYMRAEEDVYLAYIRGDDFWHYRQKLIWAFGYLAEVADKKGNLMFPLEYTHKFQVLQRLRKTRGLVSRIWYCETPEGGKPCGKCTSCFTHRTALMQLRIGLTSC